MPTWDIAANRAYSSTYAWTSGGMQVALGGRTGGVMNLDGAGGSKTFDLVGAAPRPGESQRAAELLLRNRQAAQDRYEAARREQPRALYPLLHVEERRPGSELADIATHVAHDELEGLLRAGYTNFRLTSKWGGEWPGAVRAAMFDAVSPAGARVRFRYSDARLSELA